MEFNFTLHEVKKIRNFLNYVLTFFPVFANITESLEESGTQTKMRA